MADFSIVITNDDCEPYYNHVNHAHALTILERTRLKLLEEIGFPNLGFMEKGLFLVISSIQVWYKREIVEGEVTITCEDGRVDDRSVFVRQRILNDKGKVCLEAVVESKFMSGESKRSVPPPVDFVEKFLSVCSPLSEEDRASSDC